MTEKRVRFPWLEGTTVRGVKHLDMEKSNGNGNKALKWFKPLFTVLGLVAAGAIFWQHTNYRLDVLETAKPKIEDKVTENKDNITVLKNDMKHVLTGIGDIKGMLRRRNGRRP